MKKMIFSLSILLCLALTINAQDYTTDNGSPSIMSQVPNPVLSPDVTYYGMWYPGAQFPALPAGTFYSESAIIGDTLYVHCPDASGLATNVVRKTRINANGTGAGAWALAANLPASLVQGAMVACGNKLYYIGGGASAGTGGTTVFEYSQATGVWTAKAPLPLVRGGHSALAWGDSVIFVMCGPWATTTTTNLEVFRYRVSTNTWTTLTGTNALPSGAGKRSQASGISGNKMIISCGYAGGYLNTTFVGTIGANSSTITWAAAPAHPFTAGLSRVGGTACNGYFFTVGGEQGTGGNSNINYTFNFQDNAWVYTWTNLKPTVVSNVWNGSVSKLYSADTIKIFSPGGYTGSASTAAFEVARFKPMYGVGINGVDNNPAVSMFPNPANNMINFYLSSTQNSAVAEIYNTSGQLVKNYQLVTGNNVIDLTSFSKGVYIVTVKGNNVLTTEKIIVQ
jgi:N-acetylneuraminic acid mutarotase